MPRANDIGSVVLDCPMQKCLAESADAKIFILEAKRKVYQILLM